jgi:hypothetical protein
MDEEGFVEIDVCCDAFQDALDGGGIQVMEVRDGVIGEIIPDAAGESAIVINYCPFCSAMRPGNPEYVRKQAKCEG